MNKQRNRNLTPKIISILFAIVMWTYVMSEINPPFTKNYNDVAVQLLNVETLKSQGLVLVGETEHTIRVTLKGRRDELYGITKADIRATADLSGYQAGIITIPIEVSNFSNIEIDYSPKTIRLELEKIVERQKEVELEISGNPKLGYVLDEAQYNPKLVWVEGPESAVNAVDRVIARLELKDVSGNVATSLPLKPVNQRGEEVSNVDVKTAYIDVYLPVDQLRQVKIDPVVKATAAEGYMITHIGVMPEQVALRGQESILSNIPSINTEALVFENLTESVEQQVSLKLPEDVELFEDDPVTLTIVVKEAVDQEVSVPGDHVDIIGVPEGLKVDTADLPEEILLTLTMAKDYVSYLNPREIRFELDVTGLTEGEHHLVPSIKIHGIPAEQIKGYTLAPEQLSIRLVGENQEP